MSLDGRVALVTGGAGHIGRVIASGLAELGANIALVDISAARGAEAAAELGRGSVINISSIYGLAGPDWRLYEGTSLGNPAAYAASKGGLIQMTRWLATTMAPRVRVNAIAPGGVFRDTPEPFLSRYVARTP